MIIFSASCQTAKPDLVEQHEPQVLVTPTPKKEIPELTDEQFKNLNKNIPLEAREILENADEFIIGSLEGEFGGYKTNKKITINDKELMSYLTKAFYYDVSISQGMAACFNPRHSLSAKNKNNTVSLIICFECHYIKGYLKGKDFIGSIDDKFSKEIFDQILQNAKEIK
ncbi:MAG: hypothetical protein MUC29_05635 [Pyrinomonadaceae bacterium]|nr:hypothetical protein [Pyrinomonadaceae bacterium]